MVAMHLRTSGFLAEPFAKDDPRRRNGKTPDLQVSAPGERFFFCEVKSVFSPFDETGIAHTTIANNLADNIHEAAKQFRAVNSLRSVPNVLAWVSHSYRYNITRLVELLEGAVTFSNGEPVADLRSITRGRISRDLPQIDLHIWFIQDDEPSFFVTRSEPLFDSLVHQIVTRCRRPVAA